MNNKRLNSLLAALVTVSIIVVALQVRSISDMQLRPGLSATTAPLAATFEHIGSLMIPAASAQPLEQAATGPQPGQPPARPDPPTNAPSGDAGIEHGYDRYFDRDYRRGHDSDYGRGYGRRDGRQYDGSRYMSRPRDYDEPGRRYGYHPYDHPRDYDPRQDIRRQHREMERIMDETFSRYGFDPYYGPDDRSFFGPGFDPGFGPDRGFGQRGDFISPDMDIQDAGDNYVVLVNLPGSDGNSISVRLENNRISISARQIVDKQESDNDGNVIYRERRSGSFRRSMSLPGPVKKSGMKTDYVNGVLRITIPKA